MKLKSFYADSVEEALSDARREFGPEAVLVQSRRTTPEARQFGEYEVVCALLPEDETASVAAASREKTERAAEVNGGRDDVRRLAGELAELRRCMERIESSIALASAAHTSSGAPAPVREILATLQAAEVEPNLAQRIVSEAGTWAAGETAEGDFIPGNGVPFSALVHRFITRLAAVRTTLGDERPGKPRAVALVGPPGAGKTACIAKLAARQSIMHRSACVVALDEYRVGGSEQLRAYASILGVEFETLRHDASLPAIADHHTHDLLLVDVPGFSSSELTFAGEVARRLQAQDVEVQLVVPASLRAADLRRVCADFSIFRPSGMIFTRLDETEVYGPVLNEIVRTGVPASFLAGGPHVPDDIEPASRSRIADLILCGARGNAGGVGVMSDGRAAGRSRSWEGS